MTNNSLANELAIHNFTRREKASESELKTTFKQRHLQKIMPITGLNFKGCLIFFRILIYVFDIRIMSHWWAKFSGRVRQRKGR